MQIDNLIPALIQRVGALEAAQTTARATLEAAQTTAYIALVAAIISFVGVIVTGIISLRTGFVQARTTQQLKHAEFRQKWIDELRLEMAKFTLLVADPGALTTRRPEVLQSMAMIMMRMDREDEDHDRLFAMMNTAIATSGSDESDLADAEAFGTANAQFLTTCQAILKREWEVLKKDMHSTPWGWPISTFVQNRRRKRRAERVEINRRRREHEELTPDHELISVCRFRVEWKARQKTRKRPGEPRRFGPLIFRRVPDGE